MRQHRLRQIRELIENELATVLTEQYNQPVEYGVPLRYYLDFKTDSRLIELREALDRIERGCFGSCSLCGIQIPARILEVSPTRQLCPGCDESSFLNRRRREHSGRQSEEKRQGGSLDAMNVKALSSQG
jgi:RNA polymerase-binding transcription factor DksA